MVTTFPIINLGSAPVRPKIDPLLEVIAAGFTEPFTFITSPTKAIEKVRNRRKKIETGDMRELRKVNREILTKAVTGLAVVGLGSVAVGRSLVKTIVPKLIPTTPTGIITATTSAGLLVASPTVRNIVGGFIRDPVGVGVEGGIILEKAIETGDAPGLGEALLIGGIVGGGVAAVVGGNKLIDKIKGPSEVPTSIALPTDLVPDALAPISDTPVIATTPEPSVTSAVPDVNIKIINKPQVNVANAIST